MQSLFELIAAQCGRPLRTVVHVGAGDADQLHGYASLEPTRVVLVEGDPDVAAELSRRAAAWPWAQVQACALAPEAGPRQWHRYNIASLNGPLEAAGLAAFYPRLKALAQVSVPGTLLADVLAPLQLARDPKGAATNVLVLDVPGQEIALLDSIDDSALQAFDHVIVRGCRLAYAPGSNSAQEAFASLQRRFFRATSAIDADATLWPTAAFALDHAALAANQARQRSEELRQALAGRDEAVEALRAAQAQLLSAQAEREALAEAHRTQLDELAQARERLAQLAASEAAAQHAASERAAQAQELILTCNTQSRLANQHLEQFEAANRSKAEFERIAYERHAEIQVLTKAKAEFEQLSHERHLAYGEASKTIDALKAALVERDTGIAQLKQSLAEQTRMHEQQAAHAQALLSDNQKYIAEVARLKGRLEPADKRVIELESLNGRLVAESKDRESRQRLLDSEILKAEAQLELIKEVLLREKNF